MVDEDFEAYTQEQKLELAKMKMESELRPVRDLIARVSDRLPDSILADNPLGGGPDPEMGSWLYEVRRLEHPRRVMMLRYDFGEHKLQIIRQTDDAGTSTRSYKPGDWPAVAPDAADAEERLLTELDWLR